MRWKIWWIGANFLFFPAPKSTHSSSISSFNSSYNDTTSNSTSVSAIQITIFLWPCLAIFFTCKNMFVSVSPYLHGLTLVRSKSALLLMQVSSCLLTSVLSSLPMDTLFQIRSGIILSCSDLDEGNLSSSLAPLNSLALSWRTPFPLLTRLFSRNFALCKCQIPHPLYPQHTDLLPCEN